MKNSKFLIPHFFKYVGLILFGIGIALFVLELIGGTNIREFVDHNAKTDVFAIYALALLGLVLITFSKEKQVDEYIENLQFKSFFISIIIHSLFFFVFTFTNLTLSLINFPAILLMNSILIIYLISYYIYRVKS